MSEFMDYNKSTMFVLFIAKLNSQELSNYYGDVATLNLSKDLIFFRNSVENFC